MEPIDESGASSKAAVSAVRSVVARWESSGPQNPEFIWPKDNRQRKLLYFFLRGNVGMALPFINAGLGEMKGYSKIWTFLLSIPFGFLVTAFIVMSDPYPPAHRNYQNQIYYSPPSPPLQSQSEPQQTSRWQQ